MGNGDGIYAGEFLRINGGYSVVNVNSKKYFEFLCIYGGLSDGTPDIVRMVWFSLLHGGYSWHRRHQIPKVVFPRTNGG